MQKFACLAGLKFECFWHFDIKAEGMIPWTHFRSRVSCIGTGMLAHSSFTVSQRQKLVTVLPLPGRRADILIIFRNGRTQTGDVVAQKLAILHQQAVELGEHNKGGGEQKWEIQ
jgi:hypothetical protein